MNADASNANGGNPPAGAVGDDAQGEMEAPEETRSAAPEQTAPDTPVANSVEVGSRAIADLTESRSVSTRKPWWQHAWAIFGAAVGIIGAVTGVVGVLPLIFRDATDAESLTVSVQAADSDLAPLFAIPFDADWSTFPSSTESCSDEQRAWFEEEGTELFERYLVSVSNTAAEGAMLSLKDFRGAGEVASTLASAVGVVCDQSGTGGSALRAALIDPATGRTAVYRQADPTLPDNPLVFNLAPGENGEFAVLVQSSMDFDGEIEFTAALGPTSWSRTLPIAEGVHVPGLAAQRLIVSDGRLACVSADDCDPWAVIADLTVAHGGA